MNSQVVLAPTGVVDRRPNESAAEDRRAEIVRAAFDVFTRYGFSRGQVTAIAEQSHVSTATIYKLFDSKEALFRAAYEFGLQEMQRYDLDGRRDADPADRLRHVARGYARLLNSAVTRRIVRMQIAQNVEPAGEGRAEGRTMRTLVERAFSGALDACADAGLIDRARLQRAHALVTGFIEHQTLVFGLIIEEEALAPFSGDELADDAVRAALLAYAPA